MALQIGEGAEGGWFCVGSLEYDSSAKKLAYVVDKDSEEYAEVETVSRAGDMEISGGGSWKVRMVGWDFRRGQDQDWV